MLAYCTGVHSTSCWKSRSTLWRTRTLLLEVSPKLSHWAPDPRTWAQRLYVNTFPNQTAAALRAGLHFLQWPFLPHLSMTLWGILQRLSGVLFLYLYYYISFVLVLGTFWINRPPSGWVCCQALSWSEMEVQICQDRVWALLTYILHQAWRGRESPSVRKARVQITDSDTFQTLLIIVAFFWLPKSKNRYAALLLLFFKHVMAWSKGSQAIFKVFSYSSVVGHRCEERNTV